MAKMVKCKSCGQEIAKSAKVCPHCGAKQKKHIVLGVVLVLIGIILLAVAFGGGGEEPHKVDGDPDGAQGNNSQPPADDQTPEKTIFGVGDKVELNDIIVTLVDVRESSGGNYMTPSDGKVFVICEFEIENNSKSDIAVSSMLSFEAYIDDYSTSMSLSAMLSDKKPQLDGSVAAGKKMNGVIGYEVDPDWSTIEVRFKADFWSSKEFVFEYTK